MRRSAIFLILHSSQSEALCINTIKTTFYFSSLFEYSSLCHCFNLRSGDFNRATLHPSNLGLIVLHIDVIENYSVHL